MLHTNDKIVKHKVGLLTTLWQTLVMLLRPAQRKIFAIQQR